MKNEKSKKMEKFQKNRKNKKKKIITTFFFFCCCLEHKHTQIQLHCKTQMRGAKRTEIYL